MNEGIDETDLKDIWNAALSYLTPNLNYEGASKTVTGKVAYNSDSDISTYNSSSNKSVSLSGTDTVDSLVLTVNAAGTGYEWKTLAEVIVKGVDYIFDTGTNSEPSSPLLYLILYKPRGKKSEPLLILGRIE